MNDQVLNRLPLNALQAFSAVAQLGSVRAAAEALSVTHGAVSQQIKKLEAHLDVPLLERRGRGVALTVSGRRLAEQLAPLLQKLGAISGDIDPTTETGSLTIGCTQDVLLWLLYELQDFIQRHPAITLEFLSIPKGSVTLPEVDIAIMDVLPSNTGYGYTVLTRERFSPVGHPDMLKKNAPWPLLHDDKGESWQRWFRETEQDYPHTSHQLFLPDLMAVLTACKKGLGAALAPQMMVEKELAAGTLVRLSNKKVRAEYPYFVVTPREKSSRKAHLFSAWFKEICERDLQQ